MQQPLNRSEKVARARAFTVLLLALYMGYSFPLHGADVLVAIGLLSTALAGYALNARFGQRMYWAIVSLTSPIGYGACAYVLPNLPEAVQIFGTPEGWAASALFYGVSRVLGFGGPRPLDVLGLPWPSLP